MSRWHHRAEEIINKLGEAEVGLANGLTVPEVCRKLGVIEQTYYRWRREYGGLTRDQAKRLRELEQENARLAEDVAWLTSAAYNIPVLSLASRSCPYERPRH